MDKVKNGKEKKAAYASEFARMNKALEQEFYLEAISIGYAMMEDRLVSFLHHAGIVTRDNPKLVVNRKVYPYMRALLSVSKDKRIKVQDISVKVDIVCKLLTVTKQYIENSENTVENENREKKRPLAKKGYLLDLYNQVNQQIDKETIAELFLDFEKWRKNRNGLIHELLNKTTSSAAVVKKDCAEACVSLIRGLDNWLVKPLKQGDDLRSKYNIK